MISFEIGRLLAVGGTGGSVGRYRGAEGAGGGVAVLVPSRPTKNFDLEGDTLIQTVQHYGASYPVIADPWWVPIMIVGFRIAQAYATCQRVQCGPIIGVIATNIPTSGSGNASGGRPTNT